MPTRTPAKMKAVANERRRKNLRLRLALEWRSCVPMLELDVAVASLWRPEAWPSAAACAWAMLVSTVSRRFSSSPIVSSRWRVWRDSTPVPRSRSAWRETDRRGSRAHPAAAPRQQRTRESHQHCHREHRARETGRTRTTRHWMDSPWGRSCLYESHCGAPATRPGRPASSAAARAHARLTPRKQHARRRDRHSTRRQGRQSSRAWVMTVESPSAPPPVTRAEAGRLAVAARLRHPQRAGRSAPGRAHSASVSTRYVRPSWRVVAPVSHDAERGVERPSAHCSTAASRLARVRAADPGRMGQKTDKRASINK